MVFSTGFGPRTPRLRTLRSALNPIRVEKHRIGKRVIQIWAQRRNDGLRQRWGGREDVSETDGRSGDCCWGRALASASTHAFAEATLTSIGRRDGTCRGRRRGRLASRHTDDVWRFTGKVLRGNADALTFLKSSDSGRASCRDPRAAWSEGPHLFHQSAPRTIDRALAWASYRAAHGWSPMYAIGRGSC